MASITVEKYVHLIPAVRHSPKHYLWSSYDADADVLYVNFKKPSRADDSEKPSRADDSELTDDDVIIRYEQGQVIGLTILNASHRFPESNEEIIGANDSSKLRPVGIDRGLTIPLSFFDPLPDDLLNAFCGDNQSHETPA